MSNLGAYQWMTSTCKKVGGPTNLLLLAGSTGAAIYAGCQWMVKQCVKSVKTRNSDKPTIEANADLYYVASSGKSNEGLRFDIGDQFRVIEADGDPVLIEKLGDENNPYFVSAELLYTISDYKRRRGI